MPNVIEMTDVCKTYGKGESKVNVLNGVSLAVAEGEFLAILGPSGSGKSTLMNLIGLIDTVDSGTYLLEGVDIRKKRESAYAKLRSRKIGFVFQKFNLIPKYNALYNVALPLLLQGMSYGAAKKAAMVQLELVGLGDRWKHRPNQLSGGQQQRVAIARALVGGCSILLADEPTGALDQKTGQDVLALMKELNAQGKTILLITHDPNVAKHAGRVIRVEDGEILADTAG